MKTVWKFPLAMVEEQEVAMPAGADVVHVDGQGHSACIWATVDPSAEKQTRRFAIVGTGHAVPANAEHVGTALLYDGAFVCHVFEVAA